jgi:hypothetical protein
MSVCQCHQSAVSHLLIRYCRRAYIVYISVVVIACEKIDVSQVGAYDGKPHGAYRAIGTLTCRIWLAT